MPRVGGNIIDAEDQGEALVWVAPCNRADPLVTKPKVWSFPATKVGSGLDVPQ